MAWLYIPLILKWKTGLLIRSVDVKCIPEAIARAKGLKYYFYTYAASNLESIIPADLFDALVMPCLQGEGV